MSQFKKGKKRPNQGAPLPGSWYEEARTQGYLDQVPQQKKVATESLNPLDQGSLDQLSAFKKNLETQQEKDRQEALVQAKKRAQEEEKATHWYELAEKKGYLN